MMAIHPGRILKRELAARQLSCNALAREIRVPPGRIIDIVNGKRAITAETALRLGRYLGTGGRLWMALQARFDLISTENRIGARIEREIARAA
jgi:addiction module HigA family antidote